nr:gamma-tubulin [Cryptomonas sp.]
MKGNVYAIQIGQCGLQLGHEFWKQMCSKFYINPDGSQKINYKDPNERKKEMFFNETSSGKMTPRAILFDLEPRILNKLKNSTFSNFYSRNNMISDKQSAGNNWVNGYNKASEYRDILENIFRKNIERCDQTPSFNIFHSLVGGTGSGASSFILEMIRDEFLGKFISSYTIIPNQKQNSDTVVQPYNSILSLRWLTLYCNCVILFENSSIERIINCHNGNVKTHLLQINSLIAKIITISNSSILSSEIFEDDMEAVFTPLIPTPNLHFFTSGISNHNMRGKKKENIISSKIDSMRRMILNHSTSNCFKYGKLISSFHFLNHKSTKMNFYEDLRKVYEENKIKFIDWAPPSIHYSNNKCTDKENSYNTEICFYNHTSVKSIFKETLKQYDILRKRNAFLNNYLREFTSQNGIETFDDARETIHSLISEYAAADTCFFP